MSVPNSIIPTDPMAAAAPDKTDELRFVYRNYRGEVSERRVKGSSVRFMFESTEWHPKPQWLLSAIDLDKSEWRDFACKDVVATEDLTSKFASQVAKISTELYSLIEELQRLRAEDKIQRGESAPAEIAINFNDNIRVVLTEAGVKTLKTQHEGIFKGMLDRYPWTPPEVDAEGYSTFQLHTLMHDLGHSMFNGNTALPVKMIALYRVSGNPLREAFMDSFITATSGGDEKPFLKAVFATIEQMHEAHNALCLALGKSGQ